MDFPLFVAKVIRRLRNVGVWRSLQEGLEWLRVRAPDTAADEFDVKHGTDTRGHVPLWKFKISSPNARFGAAYQTVDEKALVDAVSILNEDARTFTFVDLGCGKGKALLVAAQLGFKEIIGVEFVHELAQVARKNLERVGSANSVVLESDAAKYRFPNCDLVLYLFNPFSQEVMREVIANLRTSHTGKLYVVYATPQCADLLDSSGFLTRLGSPPGQTDIQIWSAAASTPKHFQASASR